jgi:hypothetical protein
MKAKDYVEKYRKILEDPEKLMEWVSSDLVGEVFEMRKIRKASTEDGLLAIVKELQDKNKTIQNLVEKSTGKKVIRNYFSDFIEIVKEDHGNLLTYFG